MASATLRADGNNRPKAPTVDPDGRPEASVRGTLAHDARRAPLLEARALACRFPNGRGVGPVTIRLEPGIHGLLGPNGSGKTTLLKTILGFHAPTSGQAWMLGHDIVADPLQVRRHVGYMAENDVFVPGLNAAQTVRLAAELCGIPARQSHEAASEALQAVGLGEEAFHSPARLSTGQRQKMKLAAALVHAPRLLILDEPTNGLDPVGRRTMLELVRELATEKGVSVVLSTHILPDVQAVCDDALILRDGLVAGQERIAERVEQRLGQATWYRIESLSDPEPFIAACRAQGLEVRDDGGSLKVAAPSAASLVALARKSGTILASATPATTGAEERILQSLGATPMEATA